jgi:hypothetical protein
MIFQSFAFVNVLECLYIAHSVLSKHRMNKIIIPEETQLKAVDFINRMFTSSEKGNIKTSSQFILGLRIS